MKRQATKDNKNKSKFEMAEKIVKEEAKRAFEDRIKELEVPRMGYFDLVPDDDANTEVLTNDQVYKDLQKLEGILGKNDEPVNIKSLAMRKKTKKRK